MPLQYGQIPDAILEDNTYSFRLGHVERVFTSPEDIIITDTVVQSQEIRIKPIGHVQTKRKPILSAIPLLRGISDSVTRGDIVLYTHIGETNFYLGPINTLNSPSKSPDMMYSISYNNNSNYSREGHKFDRDRSDGYNRNIPAVTVPKLSKIRRLFIDFPNRTFRDDFIRTKEYYESGFTDVTLEGRYGNGLRLGARNEFPQLIISNNNYQNMESLYNGSIVAMTSLGSIQENFFMDENFQLASDIKISQGYEDETSEYKGSLLDFDYSFGQINIENSDERTSVDQIIINSDRILFNSKIEDITLSSNRGIKIGAGGNIEMTNKGYSVFESRNIYIGKKAKDRSQPMVLGEELRRLLVRILRLLADAQALGDYNVPQALTVFPNVMQAGSLRTEIDSIMKDFNLGTLTPGQDPESPDPGYLPNVEEGEPVGDRATGNATFFSQHHFIETNREQE